MGEPHQNFPETGDLPANFKPQRAIYIIGFSMSIKSKIWRLCWLIPCNFLLILCGIYVSNSERMIADSRFINVSVLKP